jgi:cytochrome c556
MTANRWKALFIASAVLWAATAGVLVFLFVHGNTSASTDGRTAVHVNAAEKDIVLREMRMLLTSLNEVTTHVAAENYDEAAKSAARVGMAMETAAEAGHPALIAKLPLELKRLGFATHEDMDELAALLKKGSSQKEVLSKMSETTSKCVACHSVYRLEASR